MGAVCPVCDDDDDLIGRGGDDEDAPLTGRWISGRGQAHVIGLHAIQWNSGDVTGFKKVRRRKGCYKYVVDMKGSEHSAAMTPEGHLQWNDGDLWKRDPNGPQTGTYVAVAGALAPATKLLKTATSFVISGSPVAGSSKSQGDSPSTAAPSPSPWRDGASSIGSPCTVREAFTSPVMANNLFGTLMPGYPGHPVSGHPSHMSNVSTQYASQFPSHVSTQFSGQFSSQIPGFAPQQYTQLASPGPMSTSVPTSGAGTMPLTPTTNPGQGVVPRPKRRLAPQTGAPLSTSVPLMPDR